MTYELLLGKFFSMELLLSLLYRNWSVNLFNQITRLVGVPDFLRCTLRSVANHVIA